MFQADVKNPTGSVVACFVVRPLNECGSDDVVHERVRGHVDAHIAPLTSAVNSLRLCCCEPLVYDRVEGLHKEESRLSVARDPPLADLQVNFATIIITQKDVSRLKSLAEKRKVIRIREVVHRFDEVDVLRAEKCVNKIP